MSAMLNSRREFLVSGTATAVSAGLPMNTVAPEPKDAAFGDPPTAPDPDDLGIFVPGCGCACDCSRYLRAHCAWGRLVRKLGDKYIVYDANNNVIGEADPGFRPLPEDAEWVAKVEYAKANNLPHHYDWPKEKHAEWRLLDKQHA
jgi:hypothetical protein